MQKTIKTIFLLAVILLSTTGYSQDSLNVRQVDSLVRMINNSDFKIQRDSIKQDQPGMGLSMRTYLTMVSNGTELKKYVNNIHITRRENGVTKQMITTNTFYFDHNKLIKVEEFAKEGDKKMEALWYYADDKPIYYTLKDKERAEFLLTIAKAMLEKIKL